MPSEGEHKQADDISTSDKSVLSIGDQGAKVGAERTVAKRRASGIDAVQRVE
jgi:hypothetical protein